MDQPIVEFASKDAFETWLEEHHATSDGVWIKIAKQGSGIPSVNRAGALDVALCFGWIDGQAKPIDETHYLQKFTPRRARSKWSKINVGKVAELIESGRMRPAGHAEIERAKADGRWDAAYEPPSTSTVPPDLQAELDADAEVKANFEALSSSNRFSILYRLQDAKKPETRARRLEKFVGMLKRGETIH
jgi:uncharacterized protein YdeI (YjbR/CyaY-like superfamily)